MNTILSLVRQLNCVKYHSVGWCGEQAYASDALWNTCSTLLYSLHMHFSWIQYSQSVNWALHHLKLVNFCVVIVKNTLHFVRIAKDYLATINVCVYLQVAMLVSYVTYIWRETWHYNESTGTLNNTHFVVVTDLSKLL